MDITHKVLAAATNTKLVETNVNRVVLTILNIDPGSNLVIMQKPIGAGTFEYCIPPYASLTLQKSDGDTPEAAMWGWMTSNLGRVIILEEVEKAR